jgi:MerR family transcriptional regulator/heat shock protein HspR
MDRLQFTSSRAVYVISVAAELADMHPQTLRMYERKGLLEPARTSGGSRRYSDDDIARLQRIASLAAEGMNLSGIRRVMELEAENAQLREQLAEAERRNPRRDLVPVRQAMAMFSQTQPPRRRD